MVDPHSAAHAGHALKRIDVRQSIFRAGLIAAMLIITGCDQVPVGDAVIRKVEAAKARNDGPAIWRVSDEDSTLYLYGTVHLLPSDLSWQRDDMREAFADAGTVFFEADHTGAPGLRAEALATREGLRRDGQRLTDTLDNYQANLLEAVANNGRIDLAALDAMQPWLATELITLSAARAAGLSSDLSADEALKSRADRMGKNVVYFETAEDQVRQVSELPEAVQIAVLTNAMERFDEMAPRLGEIAQRWAAGDIERLQALVSANPDDVLEGYLEAVLLDRNERWGDRLIRFLEGRGTGFAAIGAAHLLGENSLIDVLEDEGYDVQRYLAFLGDDVIKPVNPTLPDVPGADE